MEESSPQAQGLVSITIPKGDRTSGDRLARVPALKAQTAALQRVANLTENEGLRPRLLAAISTLEAITNDELERLIERRAQVLVIPDNASAVELRNARQRRAVLRGEALYLPAWPSGTVGLPNILLRSALFSCAQVADSPVENLDVPVRGNASIRLWGRPLTGYDRRVLAACLSCVPGDQPICTGAQPNWFSVSVWRLAQALNVSFGRNVQRAILDSLARLNQARLRVRLKGEDLPDIRLLELDAESARLLQAPECEARPRSSDQVTFRIAPELADLFGRTGWCAVSDAALHNYSGLAAWLVSYYSTQAGTTAQTITELFGWSGSVCDLREFRRRIKRALQQLQQDDVPEDHRVAAFELTDARVIVRFGKQEAVRRR